MEEREKDGKMMELLWEVMKERGMMFFLGNDYIWFDIMVFKNKILVLVFKNIERKNLDCFWRGYKSISNGSYLWLLY